MTTRLFHISDVHFGVEDPAALSAVERAVQKEKPDALVCTGDVTQRATHAQYAAAAEWFSRMDVPVWIDPGNHDMPYYNLFERFSRPYDRFNALHRSASLTTFETEDVVLVPLKTIVRSQNRWPWSDGVVTDAALSRTVALLKSFSEDERALIVTAHHPLLGPRHDGPSDTIGGPAAFDALVENGMNAVMTGHIHRPFNEFRSGGSGRAQMIGAGTISTRLRHGAPPSYNVLTCKRGEEIAVEPRIVGDPPKA
ncbi:MAG: metallophosphoesterase [Pseudomonadota bacterium]|nr:metallophosphoesterase [Pseudomonadota bacterium]